MELSGPVRGQAGLGGEGVETQSRCWGPLMPTPWAPPARFPPDTFCKEKTLGADCFLDGPPISLCVSSGHNPASPPASLAQTGPVRLLIESGWQCAAFQLLSVPLSPSCCIYRLLQILGSFVKLTHQLGALSHASALFGLFLNCHSSTGFRGD